MVLFIFPDALWNIFVNSSAILFFVKNNFFKIISGFILLFFLYHAAEYMIVFKNSPTGFLGFQFLFFLTAWLVAKWQTGKGLSAWGLGLRKHFLQQLLIGILIGIVLYGLYFFISIRCGAEKIVSAPSLNQVLSPFFLFVFGNFFSSFSEDILTRGYVYQHSYRKLSGTTIVLLSALVYLLNHIYRLSDGPQAWIYLFALGIFYVLPLIISKRLWFTGGMHWSGNCFFFFTHGIMTTDNGSLHFSPNYILVICILLLLPVTIWITKSFTRKFELKPVPYEGKD